MRNRIIVFISVAQSILFFLHWFVFETWKSFSGSPNSAAISDLGHVVAFLSVTFVTASLLAHNYYNVFVRAYYKAAAAWLGFFSFFVLAACFCWILLAILRLSGVHWERQSVAYALFGAAIFASVYGLVNASSVRVKQITVALPNLPENWRGRVVALITDVHLGNVRGHSFLEQIVKTVSGFKPDLVLIGGDLYDGTVANERRLAEPLRKLVVPFGTYFISGNHEEFRGHAKYFDAVEHAGVRLLNNEKVMLDGLQLVGVHYLDSTDADHFRGVLQRANVDRNGASILLVHAPHHLPVVEEAGIGLQLSGHTHGGQYFPFTSITSRIYRQFVYGLNRLGNLLVYTSYGAGTWGPPLRVGTTPEVVLITLE